MELQLNPFLIAVRKYNKLRRICMETNLCRAAGSSYYTLTIYCVYLRERAGGGRGF